MEEILIRLEKLTGSRRDALTWYHTHPIAGLDGLTAEQLVSQKRIEELNDFLDSVENGADIDMQSILWDLENDRRSGNLSTYVAQQSWVRYGVSEGDPEGIEAVDRLGRRWGYELEDVIRKRIEKNPLLSIIKLSEQPEYHGQPESLEGIFEHLLQDGTLRQYHHDWFYRSHEGCLGPRGPSQNEILNALMFTKGRRTGYITGPALYNRLGLTTQMAGVIKISTMQLIDKEQLCLGGLRIKMVPARFEFDEQDIPALEILDAITDLADDPGLASLDAFPDADSLKDREDKAKSFMRQLIQKKPIAVQDRLQVLASRYPERTTKAFFEIIR